MSEPHNQVILDSIAEGVFTVDRDWRITSFNRAAEEITGVSREQAVGQKCFDVFRADICQAACALRDSVETGRPRLNLRVNILNADGDQIPISVNTAVLRDEKGDVVGGVETFRDLSTVELLRRQIDERYTFADMVSKNHEMQRLFQILPDVARSDSTVLLEGPSGSGKELLARALHNLSDRRDARYVAVNCAALPDTLLESELFGYVRGAFTDAKTDKPGRFALAEGGTLFLDEIGDLSTALQVKLLRVLQEKEYEPLGATTTRRVDARVIAATNRNLAERVAHGQFRDDLFYRLNVVRLELPPLARRREDIPLLADHFVRRFNATKGREIEGLADAAMDALMRYAFPGNIRELENAIEHAFVLCHEPRIDIEHLPPELVAAAATQGRHEATRDKHGAETSPAEPDPLARAEASAILKALRAHDGHRARAAAELGIDKSTLWRKMKRLGLDFPRQKGGRPPRD